MPEYLAPGVYVEETSFRARSIEGVSTSTTAFVGLARRGPVNELSELLTSLGDYERIYGGLGSLTLGGAAAVNYLGLAVAAYFNNGGSRLYVSRAFVPAADDDTGIAAATENVIDAAGENPAVRFVARFPGSGGEGTIVVEVIELRASARTLEAAPVGSVVRVIEDDEPALFVKRGPDDWRDEENAEDQLPDPLPDGLTDDGDPRTALLTLAVTAAAADGTVTSTLEDVGLDPAHPRWLGNLMAAQPARRREQLENLFAIESLEDVTPFALAAAFAPEDGEPRRYSLTNGNDGGEPGVDAYTDALEPVARYDEISIVAAPGYSSFEAFAAIQDALITHVEAPRAYRIAVLDTPPDQVLSEAQAVRSRIDSTRAALYYPWVVAANPLARPGDAREPAELALPPSGFVAGIYARNDAERGVHKAPANEVVRGALRFETDISMAEQAVLNPRGINCLRFFEGRGYRVWGARTATSDPEWKYVNVRRYFIYLERSIDRGTQWVVFEPNGERLWTNVTQTVTDFLYNEWVSGALLGSRPEEAFFVRCDRSTMTQADLDNGRLICLVGVAVLKPAEFVIFRVGQKTADART
jgi:uncharacterized protein